MSMAIRQLASILLQIKTIQIKCNDRHILATVRLSAHRSQTVLLSLVPSRFTGASFLRFQSRVCVAKGPSYVKTALRSNAETEWCGLALDTSVTPNMIDLTYSMIAEGSAIGHIVAALQRLAETADELERTTGSTDQF